MGGDEAIGHLEELVIWWQGLGIGYIQSSRRDPAVAQSSNESLGVYHGATRSIDQYRRRFHSLEGVFVDQAACLGSERRVQADEIALPE